MKKFMLYGHPMGEPDEIPKELSEVCISTTPANLRKLAAHFLQTADDMEHMGDDFDHVHMQPQQNRSEIVITRYNAERFGDTKIIYDFVLGYKRRVPKKSK
jgi:hypothetical protein